MKQYVVTYRVAINADDENTAELIAIDLEGEIKGLNHAIKWVDGDPYMEEVEE